MKQRAVISIIAFMLCLCVLIGRLYYIQVICAAELTTGANRQQMIPVLHPYSRGTIFDRNMEKLTDDSCQYYYLVHRQNCTETFTRLMNLIEGEIAGTKGDDYLVYRAEVFQPTINFLLKENCQVYGFCVSSRYANEQVAAHLIGYLNTADGTGSSGLEKLYEERLRCDGANLHLVGDGIGQVIKGAGLVNTEAVSASALVTTIDKNLQKQVENILAEKNLSGAVIVLETNSGQVLAMASSPTFNPNRLTEYLASDGSELVNKVTQGQYPPGSVFKIVVAAAALEDNPDLKRFQYTCKGKVVVNGVELICEGKKDGHGKQTLKEAFAHSCNCYFAKLAETIGSEKIFETAKIMGLGGRVLDDFPDEAEGSLPTYAERHFSGLSNFAVGQGSLLVTPLQICQMTNIIANKGVLLEPVLVMSSARSNRKTRIVVSTETAAELGEMMRLVMTEGTAASAKFDISVAGKTGSAETSVNGKAVVHGWFTGFFPADEPKYTVSVFIENGKTGSQSALPVFQEIVEYLY